MTSPLNQLRERLAARFPDATFHLDLPASPTGPAFLDITHDGYSVEIEFLPQHGFGVSARDAVFGERPDETVETEEEAFRRVRRLLLSHAPTAPPRDVTLADLRKRLAVSQVDLAQRLDVSQASVSKTERRSDLLLGTLRQFIGALGGTLEIRARFDDETVRITLDPPTP